jgi:hypothetical protein
MTRIQSKPRYLEHALHDQCIQKRVLWILCALSLVFLIASIPAKARIGYGHPLLPPRGDPFGHYVYMPALLLHHNVQFQNLLERYIAQNHSPALVGREGMTTQRQRPAEQAILPKDFRNYWSVGHAILLSPFFLLGQLISYMLSWCGFPVALDGFAWPNQVSAAIGVILLFFFALSRFHDLLAARFGYRVAGPISLVAIAGTFFLNYTLNEQYMAHASTFVTAVFYLRALINIYDGNHSPFQFGIAAFWLGLVFLVRPQNALLGFPLLVVFLIAALERQHPCVEQGIWIKRCILFILLGGSVCLLQLFLWKIMFGNWMTLPQGGGFIDLRCPRILSVLFSKRHGLFYWHPFLLFGAGAVLLHILKHGLWNKASGLLCGTLLSCLCITYLNASAADWWAGTSFGARRFDGLIVFILFACAHGLAKLSEYRPQWQNAIITFCFGAILWNCTIWLIYLFDLSPEYFPKS